MINRRNTENIFGIDVFRGISIVLMFITHGSRLYNGTHDNSWLNHLLKFFSLIEPFTSASFLFLVGVGLNLSFNNTKVNYTTWLKQNCSKAGILYLIGLLFFFMEYGLQIPEMFLGPSILSVIALAIISLSLCITSPIFLFWGSILISAITLTCEGSAVTGVNTGPGGAFPLILFTFLGYLSYNFLKNKNKTFGVVLVIGLICWFFPYSFLEHWTQTYPSIYNHFSTGQTGIDYILSLGTIDGYSKVGFWNHTLVSGFRLLIPLISLLWILINTSKILKKYMLGIFLARYGRHALGLYIVHLIIIAILDFLNFKPSSAATDWFLILGLLVAGNFYAKYKELK